MIDAIEIAAINSEMYYDENDMLIRYISNLNKINIFIGENNSGKSKLMRYLVSSDNVKILSNSYVKDKQIINDRNRVKEFIGKVKEVDKTFESVEDLDYKNNVNFFIEVYKKINLYKARHEVLEYQINNYISTIESCLGNMLSRLIRHDDRTFQISIFKKDPIYIPILRGIENFNIYFDISRDKEIINSITMTEKQRIALEAYKDNANHIYQNKIQKAYGIKQDLIFTAENLYEDITEKLLGEEKGRIFIRDFQNFISEQFYNGKEFTLIPQKSKGYINVKIGQEERPIYQLGDGIKQLITILYKIYENKDNEKIFFIEEPELNLHPGFQRRLIEILQLEIFDKHQYFITTHSNHLIDSCFDYNNISIYKFVNVEGSNKKFKIISSSQNDVSLLQALGVNNSSVFMANCTIWVEGISDKILIKKYLEKYFEKHGINKYREDIHYAFVEYGGNNITHWDFEATDSIDTINAIGITNRSFIVCDNDNDAPHKIERKKKLKSIFKENYYELKVREIENTISKNVLDKMLFDDSEVAYRKQFNQRDYMNKKVYMGKFIDEHYKLSRKYSSSNGTGTIKDKLNFSKRIANTIENYKDLSTKAIDLCEKIAIFIEKSNTSDI